MSRCGQDGTRAPVNPRLLGHLATFESSLGLWRLNKRLAARRLAWRWFVESYDVGKRGVDVVGSVAALISLSPLLILVAALLRLDGGSVLFAQTRVGRFGRQFKMFKFRSMRPDAPRITRLGHWLRRFSLDELPQFYNVLIGDMSLVGPRPPVPREAALYSLADRRRLVAKPGLTCTWQVSGRAKIDFPRQVQLDVTYIESQSFAQDMRILARTPRAVFLGHGSF